MSKDTISKSRATKRPTNTKLEAAACFDRPVDAHATYIVSEEREKIDAQGKRYSDFEVLLEMTPQEFTYVKRFIGACRGHKAA